MRKGIFWCKDFNTECPELIMVSTACDGNGCPIECAIFSSKSGENFNHEAEWSCLDKHITENHPYNYYPRGRVEIKNKKVTIYINPDINKERILCKVADAFELMVTDELKCIKIKSDGSNHYRYTCDAV